MNNGKIPTGFPLLNQMLSRPELVEKATTPLDYVDPSVLKEGVDVLSQAKTFLRQQVLTAAVHGGGTAEREVFVVYGEQAGMEKGLFFITRTLAEVHFDNITGVNKAQDNEKSGGRTLTEMIEYLFHG